MKKDETITILAKLKPDLIKRFGLTRMALFGSTVRIEAAATSDINILVAFNGPATSEKYFGVQFLLEDSLGHPVDLVTEKAMRAELRRYIEREAVNVWTAMALLSGRHDPVCGKRLYSENLDQFTFVEAGLNYDAVVRNLELFGETATHIPIEIRESYSSIPWRQLIATRNRLIHGYFGLDNDTLWSIIKEDIPHLLDELQQVFKNHKE